VRYYVLEARFLAPQKEMCMNSDEARTRAEKAFRKEEQARAGAQAWLDYEAAARATQEKTARLRALRLAKQAAKKSGR